MSSYWKRDGIPDKDIRIVLCFKKGEYPDVVKWWWSMPWGKGSAAIKTILQDAISKNLIPVAVASNPEAPVFSFSSEGNSQSSAISDAEAERLIAEAEARDKLDSSNTSHGGVAVVPADAEAINAKFGSNFKT